MPNILYISYDGMTDPLGQSQVLPYLAGLSKKGYKITVLSFEKAERLVSQRENIQKVMREANIAWEYENYTKWPPVLSTLLDIWKMFRKIKTLHKIQHFSLIHCRSYISALAGLQYKRTQGIKFIFDMRGFWADERVDGKIWNLKNPVYKVIYNFFKRKEQAYFSESDAVVSLTHAGKREILKWRLNNVNDSKISVIPCSSDFNLFTLKNEILNKEYRKKLEIPHEAFVLTYLGAIGTWYLLDEMLDFYKELQHSIPDARLLFITAESHELIRGAAEKKGISQDRIVIRKVDRKEVPSYLSVSDWGISFIKPCFSKQASSPTKLGEMLAMGIPVIVNANVGDVKEIVNSCHAGLCLQELNTNEYKRVVNQLLMKKSYAGEEIRNLSMEINSLDAAIESYTRIYQSLIPQ